MEDVKELEKLKCLPFLRALVLAGIHDTFEVFVIIVFYRLIAGCPLSEMDEYRVEICLVLRKLERLDKDKFTEDERADAEEVCCTHEMLKFIFSPISLDFPTT